MQIDFHYYMTYMAARAAGYERQLSRIIGEYDEIVDETFGPWVKSKWHPKQMLNGLCHRTVYSTMDWLHFIKAEGRKADKAMPWIAFHFLPGLGTDGKYPFDYNAHDRVLEASIKTCQIGTRKFPWPFNEKIAARLKRFRQLRAKGGLLKWDYKQQLMCWPDSPCSNAIMDDIHRIAKSYKAFRHGNSRLSDSNAFERCFATPEFLANKDEFATIITRFDEEIRKLGDIKGLRFEKFLVALLGVRMHIYSDTYSHQGFAGLRTAAINDVINIKCTFQTNGKVEKLPWKPRISEPLELTYFGHGRADCFPDLPSIRLRYTRPWDNKPIERDNPGEFKRAYAGMVKWFKHIGVTTGWDKQRSRPSGFSPRRINDAFFRQLRKPGGRNGYDEKGHRCDFLHAYIREHDDFELTPFAKIDNNFGMIRQMHARSKIDLAYFSLAALYHQRWFEKQVMTRLNMIRARNANELISKIIGPAKSFPTEVIP